MYDFYQAVVISYSYCCISLIACPRVNQPHTTNHVTYPLIYQIIFKHSIMFKSLNGFASNYLHPYFIVSLSSLIPHLPNLQPHQKFPGPHSSTDTYTLVWAQWHHLTVLNSWVLSRPNLVSIDKHGVRWLLGKICFQWVDAR